MERNIYKNIFEYLRVFVPMKNNIYTFNRFIEHSSTVSQI
jgi:hypothetical protein